MPKQKKPPAPNVALLDKTLAQIISGTCESGEDLSDANYVHETVRKVVALVSRNAALLGLTTAIIERMSDEKPLHLN